MANLELVAFFIVIASVLSFEFAISASVLELVGGLIAHNMFEIHTMPDLDAFAKLGIICLMYVAGLEIDLDLMRKNIKSSIHIGFLSFAVPFALVAVVSYFLLGLNLEQTLLVGIALSTTSVAIVYPILLESGELSSIGRRILSAAMVTDLFSMIALSVLFSKLTWITLSLVAGLFILTWSMPRLGQKIFSRYEGNPIELEFKIILLLMLGLTIASERAGIEAALVAFLMGMITSQLVVGHADLSKKFRFIVFGLFAPIFFFTVGLSIEYSEITQNMSLFLIFFVVCFVGKYVGTYFPSRIYFPDKAKTMGVLFNSRLSLGIVAATFGHEAGIINQAVYSPLIGTIILAAVISAVLMRKK